MPAPLCAGWAEMPVNEAPGIFRAHAVGVPGHTQGEGKVGMG